MQGTVYQGVPSPQHTGLFLLKKFSLLTSFQSKTNFVTLISIHLPHYFCIPFLDGKCTQWYAKLIVSNDFLHVYTELLFRSNKSGLSVAVSKLLVDFSKKP